jgi:excisionase family DNA binding protein
VRATAERYLSLQEVGDELGVSDQTVRRWVKAGELAAYKPGKEYRIKGSDLEEFLKTREVSPKAQPSLPSLEDAAQSEAFQHALAVLFRGLARRGQGMIEQSLREGPSEALSRELTEYYAETRAVHRIKGRRDIFGRDSDELAEAEAAYQEVEDRIQAMLRQDIDATDEERSTARRFKHNSKSHVGEEHEADAS